MPQTKAATMATAGAFTGRVSDERAFRYGRFAERGRRDGPRRFRSGSLVRVRLRRPVFLPSPSRSRGRARAWTDRTRDSGFLVRRERAALLLRLLPIRRAGDRESRGPASLA